MRFSSGALGLSVLALIGLALGAGGCQGSGGSAGGGALSVPMDYRPTDVPPSVVASAPGPETIAVVVTDKRPDISRIGENHEDAKSPKPVLAGAGKTPADLVQAAMVSSLTKRAFKVAADAGSATRIVNVSLTTFWTDETETYKAQVAASVDVTDKDGKSLWSGVASGGDTTFGRSYNADNYNQVFSNAAMKLAEGLIASPDFQKAAGGK